MSFFFTCVRSYVVAVQREAENNKSNLKRIETEIDVHWIPTRLIPVFPPFVRTISCCVQHYLFPSSIKSRIEFVSQYLISFATSPSVAECKWK